VVLQTEGNIAMILAAGQGTRLGPLTVNRPKALVEWRGTTLLEHVVTRLKQAGFSRLIINVHHFAEMIIQYVERHDQFGMEIRFSHEKEELLDTGGGIARASWFFGRDPFLVHNVDIYSDIDLRKLMQAHKEKGALATLAVKKRDTSRSLLMDREGFLKGWRDNRTGETILAGAEADALSPIAFSGIQVIDPGLMDLFPDREKFPLVPFYLEIANSQPVYLHRHDPDTWIDMGRLESYEG
jgi:NDP-sugar pyrophosphorylase family protein